MKRKPIGAACARQGVGADAPSLQAGELTPTLPLPPEEGGGYNAICSVRKGVLNKLSLTFLPVTLSRLPRAEISVSLRICDRLCRVKISLLSPAVYQPQPKKYFRNRLNGSKTE
jgi:hypothetical protein